MKTILLAVSFFLLTGVLNAQDVHPVSGEPLRYCGTDEALRQSWKEHPELKAIYDIIEEQRRNNPPVPEGQNPPVYIIPMVVHVLHNYGPENISDAQIKDAVNCINRDFRKLNADTTQVVAAFKSIIADCEIEVRLAQLDPSGNCTNGITRHVTQLTYAASNASKIGGWPYNKYLNVWTCFDIGSGSAGYSYYPGNTTTAYDGVMIRHDYVGSIGTSGYSTSRALSHEIAHYINIAHTWGSTNNPGVDCSGNDNVSDTPQTIGWSTCNLSTNDVCNPGSPENVQNIMEYAYCQRMFTNGQKARMRTALTSSTMSRNNLWSASNLTATGATATPQLCTADFTVSKRVVCAGSAVTFTDLSWNATPTTWQWDVDNDGTDDYTTKTPTHIYNTPGFYTVKLTVGDGTNTKTATKTSYILVLSNTASVTTDYSEGFESAGFPYADCYNNLSNGTGPSWTQTTPTAYTGSGSLMLSNYGTSGKYVMEAIFPAIDLAAATTPNLTYQVAYAQKNSSDVDVLKVFVSTNCGLTWIQRSSKTGSTLATTAMQGTAFTPTTQAQWRKETVNVTGYVGATNFRFKFEFSGGTGNNIYIDDINLSSTNGIEEELGNSFGLQVFPNPFQDGSTVSFDLQDKHDVSIGIYDMVGKEVLELSSPTSLSAGPYSFPVSKNNLNQGVYFIKLNVDGYSAVQKIVVQ